MKNTLTIIFSLTASISFSQYITTVESAKGLAKQYYEMGNNDYAFGKLEQADSLLHLAVKEKDNFIDAWILLGQINLEFMKKYDDAIACYQKVKALKEDYLGDVDYQLAKCFMNKGDYANAKTLLQTFLKKERINAQEKIISEKMLLDCAFAEDAMKHPVDFKPVNLGSGINTYDDESMPTVTADGKYLYFTRHTGRGRYQDEDIYVSVRTANGWGMANTAGSVINTENHVEGAQSISPNGKYLFFTSADRTDGLGRTDIYMSRKIGDTWERANNIGSPVNTPGYETQPCISADGRSLYFSAVRGHGKGGSDIWVSFLNGNGTWGEPQNLGDSINTMFDEMRPFLHPDGATLYFSSNGLPGMGGFDIYVSYKNTDGEWSTPINLGYPINTPGDELGIFVSVDGSKAYYASEQKDTKGQMDIYTFDMPAQFKPNYTSYIKGFVYDSDNRDPIYAQVQVIDLETGKIFSTLSSDKVNGIFLSTLPAGKNYAVEVMKDGYLFYSHNISLMDVKEGAPFEVNIALTRIKVGEKIVLNNIFFDSEKYDLKKESQAELDVVLKMLEKNPSLKIEIGGHTDNTGTDEKNKSLSENRAKSVYDYLIEKGVDASRISFKGYASSKPVADNSNAEGKAKNRRTELIVTGI